MYNEDAIVHGYRNHRSARYIKCKNSDYAKNHETVVKTVVPLLILPDLCLWMHALENPLSASEKTFKVWDQYMIEHGDFAKVSGLNMLIRAVGMKWDQSLHIDSPYGNMFCVQPLTNQYKICVLPGGNRIDWFGPTHLPTIGKSTENCVAEEDVKTLILNQGDVFLSLDCTPHAGGCSSGKKVDQGDNVHLFEFMQKQNMRELTPGTSDVAFQTHIHLSSESLSYGGGMKCSYTKTYNQLGRVQKSEEIQTKTHEAIEMQGNKKILYMRQSQLDQWSVIEIFYKALKECKEEKHQVEWRGVKTSISYPTTIASDQLKRASVTKKGTVGRKRIKLT